MSREEFFATYQLHLFILTLGGTTWQVFAVSKEAAEHKLRNWLAD